MTVLAAGMWGGSWSAHSLGGTGRQAAVPRLQWCTEKVSKGGGDRNRPVLTGVIDVSSKTMSVGLLVVREAVLCGLELKSHSREGSILGRTALGSASLAA